jgi:hypothetical protein
MEYLQSVSIDKAIPIYRTEFLLERCEIYVTATYVEFDFPFQVGFIFMPFETSHDGPE